MVEEKSLGKSVDGLILAGLLLEGKTHCVVYRRGGYALWEWHQTAAGTAEETLERLHEVQRMGFHAYPALVSSLALSGLPVEFEVDEALFGRDGADNNYS